MTSGVGELSTPPPAPAATADARVALLARALRVADMAMEAEGVPDDTRRRVMRWVLLGTPATVPGHMITPHRPPAVGVPCGVCATRVTVWTPLRGDRYAAAPCGHTTHDIARAWWGSLPEHRPQAAGRG